MEGAWREHGGRMEGGTHGSCNGRGSEYPSYGQLGLRIVDSEIMLVKRALYFVCDVSYFFVTNFFGLLGHAEPGDDWEGCEGGRREEGAGGSKMAASSS
jgi:hypothetical protein